MTSRYPSLSSYFWVALSLLLAISFAYANSLSVPFIFDDKTVILDDQFTKELKSFLDSSHIRYRHLFYMSFALNYHWDQFNTPGYHLVNISLHVLTSITVFIIAFLTIDKGVGWGRNAAFRIALITAFLFALNPAHSETVTYISGRANGLSAFFYCLALLFFILGSLKKTGFARLILYPLSLIAVASAVLSKETTAASFPFIAVFYDLCFMRGDKWIRLKDRLLYYYLPVPLIGCVVVFKAAALTSIAKWWLSKAYVLYGVFQIKIINSSIKLFFFPVNLIFDYSFSKVLDFHETGFILSVAFLIVLALLAAKKFFIKSPILSFAVLWYFIVLLPTNNFIPRIDHFNERNLYLPSFGLSLFFAVAFYLAFFSGEKKRDLPVLVGAGCLMMVLSFNSALLIERNFIYKSEITLLKDTVRKSPRNLRAMHNLSWRYLLIDDYQNAFAVLRRMLALDPSYYYTRVNLGKVYVQFGQLSQAETEFKAAIQGHPDLPEAYFNLGSLYASTGHLSEARDLYESADLDKLDFDTRLKWLLYKARVEFEMNLYEEAENGITDYFRSVETTYGPTSDKRNRPEARLLLGQIYSRTGREQLAIEEFAKVRGDTILEASAHNSLGLVYIGQARHEEAIQELALAVSLNPLLPEAQFNLGKLFLEARNDRVSAREHLDAALALVSDPDKRETINHLLRQLDH